MRHDILRVIVTAAILFAIAAAGAGVLVRTYPGTDFFPQQLFWWSLGIACLAAPVASMLWKAGTVWMVGVVTAVLLATSWITAIASAGGMFFRDTLPVHPLAHFTAAAVATVAMGMAWVAFSALGRQVSRHWSLPVRVLAVLGYWVLIGATFADPWICAWVAQFYEDMLAMPTTALFMLMDGAFYPVEIYHVLLGISLGLFMASVATMALLQRRRAVAQHALKE